MALVTVAAYAEVPLNGPWPPQYPKNTDSSPFQQIPQQAQAQYEYPELSGTHVPKDCEKRDCNYFLRESLTNPPQVYHARPYDIPFGMLNKGKLKFFKNSKDGKHNQLNGNRADETADYPNAKDDPKDSACGIPDNVYRPSKVAIHPYWLKFAQEGLGLGRYCMQDVCISVWNETHTHANDGENDVELKVTDICSTDPEDPNYCETPGDIMIDRKKAWLLYNGTIHDQTKFPWGSPERRSIRNGTEYVRPVYWFFSKCLQDGLPAESYNTTRNWFSNPILPQNTKWSGQAIQAQANNNQAPYKEKFNITYTYGAYKYDDSPPYRKDLVWDYRQDWVPGKEPKWCPVAGGLGRQAKPNGDCQQVESVAIE